MTSNLKVAIVAVCISLAAATGAMAGKSTTPNPTAPSALTAAQIAFINSRSGRDVVSGTIDGDTFSVTLADGRTLTTTSRTLALLLESYR